MKPLVSADAYRSRPIRLRSGTVSRKALTEFTRSLAVLVAARLPLLDALESAGRQSTANRLREMTRLLAHDVRRGHSLSGSMGRHPEAFDALYVQLVRVGEMTGRMADVLLRIAAYQEKAYALRRTIRLAMVYPGVIVGVSVGAVAFLLTVIVPTFVDMFADFGADLPAPTRAILYVSEGFRNHLVVLFLIVAASGVGIRQAIRNQRGRWLVDAALLRMPLAGSLIRKNLAARFCRTLGTLLESGVHLTEALLMIVQTGGHARVTALIGRLANHITRGGRLSDVLRDDDVFPAFVVQMIAVGEKTANLDQMLLHAASHLESEIDAAAATLTSVIEPVLIVVLGVVLGGILVAMYLPLFELSTVVR
ncbi:MAG: type II secretion system F family protein [Planctomycetales bacterium]|nr:type II secretion system F family protein [Planctomycetales bacterium]